MKSFATIPPPKQASVPNNTPTIWILSQGRRGDLSQMQTLVAALCWPATLKNLAFWPPAIPALAPLLLKTKVSDPLAPPWPDLILCAEAQCSMMALWVRRKSGRHSKIVCIGRPAGKPDSFDLVLTTVQYRLRPAANITELALPLSPPREYSTDGTVAGRGLHIAVLVGASSAPDWLDAAAARKLADDLVGYAAARHATLTVVMSPRTNAGVAKVLAGAMQPPHIFHAYGQPPEDSYRRIIASADEIVVTSDSVSMAIDALETGKPVQVYALPQSRGWLFSFAEGVQRSALETENCPLLLQPLAWLFHRGFAEVSADRRRLFDRLAAEGYLQWFGSAPSAHLPRPLVPFKTDLALAVARVKALFPEMA
jgi:mitochondrial fission protein ELM1